MLVSELAGRAAEIERAPASGVAAIARAALDGLAALRGRAARAWLSAERARARAAAASSAADAHRVARDNLRYERDCVAAEVARARGTATPALAALLALPPPPPSQATVTATADAAIDAHGPAANGEDAMHALTMQRLRWELAERQRLETLLAERRRALAKAREGTLAARRALDTLPAQAAALRAATAAAVAALGGSADSSSSDAAVPTPDSLPLPLRLVHARLAAYAALEAAHARAPLFAAAAGGAGTVSGNALSLGTATAAPFSVPTPALLVGVRAELVAAAAAATPEITTSAIGKRARPDTTAVPSPAGDLLLMPAAEALRPHPCTLIVSFGPSPSARVALRYLPLLDLVTVESTLPLADLLRSGDDGSRASSWTAAVSVAVPDSGDEPTGGSPPPLKRARRDDDGGDGEFSAAAPAHLDDSFPYLAAGRPLAWAQALAGLLPQAALVGPPASTADVVRALRKVVV